MKPTAYNRIESIDLLKGLVMVIMALDHVRDYFHYDSFFFDPADPAKTTLPIFFTRWITHFCAPAFSFLAGLSAYMAGKRRTRGELSSFLLKRGLWLVLLEFTIITFGWYFDLQWRTINALVIWSLGVSMVVLSALIYLPRQYVLWFSLVLIFGHNLLDNLQVGNSVVWDVLHRQNVYALSAHRQVLIGYPLIPWIAVMSLGYWFGGIYEPGVDPAKRKKILTGLGLASLLLFVVLRATNIYGNPVPWKPYDSFVKGLMDFLNPAKYPPSLQYLLMTLGGAFLFLAFTEKCRGKIAGFFSTYGRVPFFYYILHIYLLHIIAMIAAQLTGFGWQSFVLPTFIIFVPDLQGYGFSLLAVYGFWILVVLLLYPLCKKFDRYKQQHREKWWLSYL